jgi:hypothetical protein
MVSPIALEEVVFTDTQRKLRYGPIIANTISIWRKIEKQRNWESKWYAHNPIFHNNSLRSGGQPFALTLNPNGPNAESLSITWTAMVCEHSKI